MNRDQGASEACAFVRKMDFEPSNVKFDAAFEEQYQASDIGKEYNKITKETKQCLYTDF